MGPPMDRGEPGYWLTPRHAPKAQDSSWRQVASLFLGYRGILPSSFQMIISIALVYSTYQPLSVYGTVYSRGGVSQSMASPPPVFFQDSNSLLQLGNIAIPPSRRDGAPPSPSPCRGELRGERAHRASGERSSPRCSPLLTGIRPVRGFP